VTLRDGSANEWTSERSLSLRDLIATLTAQGCHPTNIGDALHEIDPDWTSKTRGG